MRSKHSGKVRVSTDKKFMMRLPAELDWAITEDAKARGLTKTARIRELLAHGVTNPCKRCHGSGAEPTKR